MSTSGSTRCVIYLRVSLDSTGERLAVDRQREDCERLARERGWRIVAEYADNSLSASGSKARPGYDAMQTAYAAGEFDALVCWDLDRLTRQPRQLEDWVDAAEKSGLLLATANGEADLSTDGGRMYARIKIAVARAEIERKSARRRSANAQRAQKGIPNKGARLTGYSVDGLTVDESEATYVRELFTRFAAGDSLKSLARWLNESGAPTRFGNPWNPTSILQILKNPRYAGRMVYQGKVIPVAGQWEPLVDDSIFDLIQQKLADPGRKTQKGTERAHLGSGLFLCGICGEKVRAWTGDRYRCKYGEGHPNRSQGPVDRWVIDVIRERLSRPDLADLLPIQEDPATQKLAAQLSHLRTRLAVIEADYDSGLIDGRRYAVSTQKVNEELAAAEAASARMGSNQGLSTILSGDPVKAFDDASLMRKRAVIDALCTVRLYPGTRYSRIFDPATVDVLWRGSEGNSYGV